MEPDVAGRSGSIGAVIFDMGGVIVELGPVSEILGPNAPISLDDFWSRWLASDAVRDFEMGRCSTDDFGARLIAEFELPGSSDALIERFATWPKGLMAGAAELVASLDGLVDAVGVLSNTNALHWDAQPDAAAVRALFGRRYLSFELGLAKPDASIYEYVIDDLASAGLIDKPAEILFLDDNQINVDGATAAGITAEVAIGVDGARAALARYGFVGAA